MYSNVSYVDWYFLLPNLCTFFTYVYDSLLLFSFDDLGQHGSGRHMNHMLPEIQKKDFRKGAQVKQYSYWSSSNFGSPDAVNNKH